MAGLWFERRLRRRDPCALTTDLGIPLRAQDPCPYDCKTRVRIAGGREIRFRPGHKYGRNSIRFLMSSGSNTLAISSTLRMASPIVIAN